MREERERRKARGTKPGAEVQRPHPSVSFFHGVHRHGTMTEAPRPPVPLQAQVFFFAILALALFLAWVLLKPFVIYMATGIFISVLALPIDRKWEKILPNKVAAFGTLLTVFIILVGPVVALGFALFNDAQELAESLEDGRLEEIILDTAEFIRPDLTEEERQAMVNDLFVETVQPWLLEQATNLASKAGSFLVEFGIAVTVILFVMYYVLTDGHRLVGFLRRVVPMPAEQLQFLMKEGHNGLKAVFFGQILTSLIQGGLGGIGFLVAGVPGAILWAGVMAVMSLLPVIGPPVIWLPASIFLLAQGEIWQGVFLLGWGAIVVAQVDNFVRPKLIGDRADIHPLFVLVGVLGGVAAFGFMGLFLGPLLVGLTVSVLKVWEKDYLDPVMAAHNRDVDARHVAEEAASNDKETDEAAPSHPKGRGDSE